MLYAVVAAAMAAGCGPVDVAAANCEGKLVERNGVKWPDWKDIPDRRVTLSNPLAHSSEIEYIRFAWDKSGLYGYVLAFEFRPVWVFKDDKRVRIVAAPSDLRARRPFGPLTAEVGYTNPETLTGGPKMHAVPRFVHRCDPVIWKPGQRSAEFFLPWSAYHYWRPGMAEHAPPRQVQIYIGDKKAILTPPD